MQIENWRWADNFKFSILNFKFPCCLVTVSEDDTLPKRRCYAPIKVLDHNFIRVPGQSRFRLDGFNF